MKQLGGERRLPFFVAHKGQAYLGPKVQGDRKALVASAEAKSPLLKIRNAAARENILLPPTRAAVLLLRKEARGFP